MLDAVFEESQRSFDLFRREHLILSRCAAILKFPSTTECEYYLITQIQPSILSVKPWKTRRANYLETKPQKTHPCEQHNPFLTLPNLTQEPSPTSDPIPSPSPVPLLKTRSHSSLNPNPTKPHLDTENHNQTPVSRSHTTLVSDHQPG